MNMTPEDIKEAVAKGKIAAISLDTSTFDRQSRRLERGLLKRIRQFRDSKVTVVISDIVARELRRHLIDDAQKAQAALKKALKDMEDSAKAAAPECDGVVETLIGAHTPASIADDRWKTFAKKTDATVLEAKELASMQELIDRYFGPRPPFSEKESKRYEFPDALALLSLETWAEKNSTFVLAVSTDPDWKAYCAESKRLVLLDDLGVALSYFQNETAQYYCRELGVSLRKGDRFKIVEAIKKAIGEQESSIEISVDADSQFSVDTEQIEHSIDFDEIHASKAIPAFEPVEFDGQTLVALTLVNATVKITAHFAFAKWDSIDREYMPMGSGTAETEENATLEVLVTFDGDIEHGPNIDSIEVLPQTIHISFSDLEPDWMQAPRNFDTDL